MLWPYNFTGSSRWQPDTKLRDTTGLTPTYATTRDPCCSPACVQQCYKDSRGGAGTNCTAPWLWWWPPHRACTVGVVRTHRHGHACGTTSPHTRMCSHTSHYKRCAEPVRHAAEVVRELWFAEVKRSPAMARRAVRASSTEGQAASRGSLSQAALCRACRRPAAVKGSRGPCGMRPKSSVTCALQALLQPSDRRYGTPCERYQRSGDQ